jgi:hypothetical protein
MKWPMPVGNRTGWAAPGVAREGLGCGPNTEATADGGGVRFRMSTCPARREARRLGLTQAVWKRNLIWS